MSYAKVKFSSVQIVILVTYNYEMFPSNCIKLQILSSVEQLLK